MSKPLILCDVDGVLADFVGHVCASLYDQYGSFYSYADFDTWEMRDCLALKDKDHFEYIIKQKWFCYDIPAYLNISKFIDALRGLGELVALTAPLDGSEFWTAERKAWLQRKGIDDVIFCPGKLKQYVDGDILIEDNLRTATQWVERRQEFIGGRSTKKAILIDRPWNQGPTPFGVYRVSSYNEALELIR